VRAVGHHHVRFTPKMWRRWLKRLNAAPNMHLREGIQEFRSLLAQHDMRRRKRG